MINKNPKAPEDLGVKFGSKEEAGWRKVIEIQEETIRNSQINLEIAKIVLNLAKVRADDEKEKFKKA